MLIDGEAVIEIAHDERINQLQLWQKQRQQAQRLHRPQRIGGVRLEQSLLQIKPKFSAARRHGGERWERLFDAVFRGRAQLQSMVRHEMKQAQKNFGILQC